MLDWSMVIMGMGAIALGLCFAIAHGLTHWQHYSQAYEFERGTPITWPDTDAWISLGQVVGMTLLPFLIAGAVGPLSLWITKQIFLRQPKKYSFWVACCPNRIIGQAVTIPKGNYTLLTILYIAPEHRGQRVGSHLLWHCLQEVKRPVYLICHNQLQTFYRRLGFVAVPSLSLPNELKRPLPPTAKVMKLSLPPVVPSPILHLPFTPSRKWSVHLLTTWREKLEVYRTLGKRKRFRRSRRQRWVQIGVIILTPFLGINSVMGILKQIPGLKPLQNFDIPIISPLGLYVSSFALAALLITLLVSVLWFVLGWQEWIVREGSRTIAYVQFSTYAHCTVLHQLHIEPQYPTFQMTKLLLGYFSRKIQFPIYVACARRDRRFYDKLGFIRVRRSALPWEMKVVQWGNPIPLQLSYDTAAQGYKLPPIPN